MDKEILENNVLIAEFMGAEKIQYPAPIYGIYKFPVSPDKKHTKMDAIYFEYHTSWDWLIPIVEKIESLNEIVSIENNSCIIVNNINTEAHEWFTTMHNKNIDSGKISKIEATYYAVVEFIKWHNKNK